MNFNHHLSEFQLAAKLLDKETLHHKKIEISTGIILNSVFLKLSKKSWSNDELNSSYSDARIFFSIWINDKAINEKKLFYNIHAFKLRKLKGYKIQSRKFAESFRNDFKFFEQHWQNVSVDFGPQTLMEGWIEFDPEHLQQDVIMVADNFLVIEGLIDQSLAKFKK